MRTDSIACLVGDRATVGRIGQPLWKRGCRHLANAHGLHPLNHDERMQPARATPLTQTQTHADADADTDGRRGRGRRRRRTHTQTHAHATGAAAHARMQRRTRSPVHGRCAWTPGR